MENIIINKGFVIRGYYVPPFNLVPGKLIRIYIPNFSLLGETLGYDLALEIIRLFSKSQEWEGIKILLPIPYAKNYNQNFWERNIIHQTAGRYLVKKFGATYNQVNDILDKFEVRTNECLSRMKFSDRKLLTIEGLFIRNRLLTFDYYGVSPVGVDKINYVIKQALDKGKCAIGLDNLQFIEEVEPYDNIERIIVSQLMRV
ncbi:hypothetical protein [Hymenobacter sp.]|jgi:hypothetical protein|uniref:hypothetical protein n=1 Tax=Hymenobacter sp. TaxID=1898978 RepID=UPI002ED8D5E8